MEQVFANTTSTIEKGGEISPFLFLSQNLELLHSELENYIMQILHDNNIDSQSLFHLQDSGEALKIKELKEFLSQGDIRPRFAFQIFFIENISRMTLQSQNACLKFFEEPGKGNIIFLTNQSESGVLETILSRVSLIQLSPKGRDETTNSFYYSMLESHISKTSDELVRYFFSGKYEKEEYVAFLKALVSYISKNPEFVSILDELHEDIGGILKNNLQGKYVVDKWIMRLGS